MNALSRISELKTSLLGQAGATLLLKTLSQILSFLLIVLLARLMGQEDFGIYIFIWGWIQILSIIGMCGMDMAALRYMGIYNSENDTGRFYKFKTFGIRVIMALGVALLIAGAFTLEFLQTPPDVKIAFLTGLVIVPFLAAIKYYQAISRVLGKIISGVLPESIIRPLSQILLVTIFFILFQNITAFDSVLIALISAFIALLFAWRLAVKNAPQASRTDLTNENNNKEWLNYGLTMIFISGSAVVLKQTDVIMLGILADMEQSGLYGAATRVANLATFALTSVNMIVAPQIAGLYNKTNKEDLQNLLSNAALLIGGFTLVLVLFLGLLSPYILMIFGNEFTASTSALQILLGAQMINALAGPVGYLMSMTGHQKQAAVIFLITALINIGLNALLIPIFGLNGAAIATGISIIIWNIAMLIFVLKKIGYNPSVFVFMKRRSS